MTPFDNILNELSNRFLADPRGPQRKNLKKEKLIRALLEGLQIYYTQMLQASDLLSSYSNAQSMTHQDLSRASLALKLAYFNFLSSINQYGRVLSSDFKIKLPGWYEIRFYRNKMIEHWDYYADYVLSVCETSAGAIGKIWIPYHVTLNYHTPSGKSAFLMLRKEFAKEKRRTLVTHRYMTYNDYCTKIFEALKRIDPKLVTGGRQKIPEHLVQSLFDYMFPSPVLDVETYCETLVKLLVKKLNISNTRPALSQAG
jgi:hypothetical protein